MKFHNIYFNETALHLAVENDNTEIVDLLLQNANTDVNSKLIHNLLYLTSF